MNISFQKKPGDTSLGIAFFWKLAIDSKSPIIVTEQFIPELFYDYFLVKTGNIQCVDKTLKTRFNLPKQALKTIYTHPVIFTMSTPLVLYGARLSLGFAESFSVEMKANCFLKQTWAEKETGSLESFKSQITKHIKEHRAEKFPYPFFSGGMDESSWLVNFSPRHKRRLYKAAFGLSRKELQNIRNIHVFLEQTCDYSSQNPRIIQHLNPGVFYDQPHLNHTFKKVAGVSPVEYFEASSILQDNLMSASYNEVPSR